MDVVVRTDPKGCRVVRCETVEPDIVVVGCGSGLTAGLNAGQRRTGTGTLRNNGFHHIRQDVGNAFIQYLCLLGFRSQKEISVPIQNLPVCDGGLAGAAVRNGGKSLCHFNRLYTAGEATQRQSRCVLIVVVALSVQGGDAELFHQICGILRTNLQPYFYRTYVGGKLHGSSHGNPALVSAVGVGRPGPTFEGQRFVHDGGSGGHVIAVIFRSLGVVVVIRVLIFLILLQVVVALLQCRAVYRQRLDGGSRLSRIQCSVEETASVRAAATDHGLNLSGAHFSDNHGTLRLNDFIRHGNQRILQHQLASGFLNHIRVALDVIRIDGDVAVLIHGFVRRRNVHVAGGVDVEFAAFAGVGRFQLHAVIRAAVHRRLVEVQTFSGLEGNGAVGVLLEFTAFQRHIALAVHQVAVLVQRNRTLVRGHVSVAVRMQVQQRREIARILEGLIHRLLGFRVHGGINLQTAAVYQLLSGLLIHIVFLLQVLNDFVGHVILEVGADFIIIRGNRRIDKVCQFLILILPILLVRNVPLVLHQRQAELTSGLGNIVGVVLLAAHGNLRHIRSVRDTRRIFNQRVGVRGLRHGGQSRTLNQAEVLYILGKITFGCRFDTVVAVAVINAVQVCGDDFFLGKGVLNPRRVPHLDDLTPQASLAHDIRKVDVSGQLLGQGTGTADSAAGKGLEDRTHHSLPVETVVIPERFIFQGHDGVHHVLRQLLVLDDGSLLAVADGIHCIPIIVVDDGIRRNRIVDVLRIDARRRDDDHRRVQNSERHQRGNGSSSELENLLSPGERITVLVHPMVRVQIVDERIELRMSIPEIIKLLFEAARFRIRSRPFRCRHLVSGVLLLSAKRKFLLSVGFRRGRSFRGMLVLSAAHKFLFKGGDIIELLDIAFWTVSGRGRAARCRRPGAGSSFSQIVFTNYSGLVRCISGGIRRLRRGRFLRHSPGGLLPFQPLLRHLAGQLLHQFIIGWFSIAHSL